jgi:uncharacterized protein
VKLKIADDLSLPVDVVTQTLAVLAKRRAGKSYTMRRIVEQLLKAGQQVVLVDPKGDQWGLRSAADGKAPGFPVVILGGERADVPLEAGSGEVVAKLVVEERVSALLDLSLFRKHEVATFMTGFLENLYRLKAREVFRTPMMLVIDEADAVAPQKPQKGEERMLGAAEDIVRRGGQRGIGCVLVTQRSAVLNKNVLTQAQVLIALRTIAPQDLDAMKAWIDVHGTLEQQRTLMESLPSLPVGDAWVWSPGWPTNDGIFKRVHVLPIETYDSGATPTGEKKRAEPKSVAEVDLEALKRQMSATIEKAKADDPRELRKQIAELKKQLAQGAPQVHTKTEPVRQVDRFVLKDGQLARAERLLERYKERLEKLGDLIEALGKESDDIDDMTATLAGAIRQTHTPTTTARPVEQRPSPHARGVPPGLAQGTSTRPARVVSPSNGHGELGNSGLKRILIALAQRGGLNRRQLGLRACLSSRSGTFDTYLSKARTNGWIVGSSQMTITDAGVHALGTYDPLPEGSALLAHWLGELGNSGAARILRALADVHPRALTRQELGEAATLSDRSGTFDTYLSKLRTLELIEGRGELKASDELFD